MNNHHALPKALKVDVLPHPGVPVMVRLRVSAVRKNDYHHYALVRDGCGAVVPFSDIVMSADDVAKAFIMDFNDIRTNFGGSVCGEVVDNSSELATIVYSS